MSESTFAVIQTGGKQYRVKSGDTLDIELVGDESAKSVKLDQVLLVSKGDGQAQVGRPFLKGAYCEAEVIGAVKAPKVISFKYIRREKSATKIGHRQRHLRVRIKSIHSGS